MYGGEGNLILIGKYQNKHIASLYRKYVENYVRCGTCRSMNTELSKDQATRLVNLFCKDCGASRNVESIKKHFHATTRKDRRKVKEAAKI